MLLDLSSLPDTGASFDVVVVGAGGAGLVAALSAAIDGARVLIVEHTGHVGGSTALSGGTTWVPGTPEGARVNPSDTIDRAAAYLDRCVGDRTPAALRRALLEAGPQVVAHLQAESDLRFRPYARHPDYLSLIDGATVNGRALEPEPFDGRVLGPLFALLRPPIPEFTVLGGMMVDRTDIGHLLAMGRSWRSFRHAAGLLLRHAADRLRHPRGTRLVMGNALVGRLLWSLSKRPNVSLAMHASVDRFERGPEGITALTLVQRGQRRRLQVRGGVVLASGGFNRHAQRRAELLPGADPDWCPGAPGHTGQAHDLVQALGARYGEGGLSNAFWAPVSLRRRADGSTAVFPHFLMDRAKPGMLAVGRDGRRFVDESTSYHLFALAMQQPGSVDRTVPAWLVCDADALRRYGLGMVRPGGRGLEPFLADGYLTRGDTLADLAATLGIDAAGLAASVTQMNEAAETGDDASFGRGTGAYANHLGDASAGGHNPNLGPLKTAPFYAVKLYPGDIGAATGFVCDERARVLGPDDAPLGGLYAVGNDMHSVMGGVYAGPGITLGPGLVFGGLAGRDAAARARAAMA